jgi:hypothetical protein
VYTQCSSHTALYIRTEYSVLFFTITEGNFAIIQSIKSWKVKILNSSRTHTNTHTHTHTHTHIYIYIYIYIYTHTHTHTHTNIKTTVHRCWCTGVGSLLSWMLGTWCFWGEESFHILSRHVSKLPKKSNSSFKIRVY